MRFVVLSLAARELAGEEERGKGKKGMKRKRGGEEARRRESQRESQREREGGEVAENE